MLSLFVIRTAVESLSGSLRNASGAIDVEGMGDDVVDTRLDVGSRVTERLEPELEETCPILMLEEEEDEEDRDIIELRVAAAEEDDTSVAEELMPLLDELDRVEINELLDEVEPEVAVELRDEALVDAADELNKV
jgi:hypothetical protein